MTKKWMVWGSQWWVWENLTIFYLFFNINWSLSKKLPDSSFLDTHYFLFIHRLFAMYWESLNSFGVQQTLIQRTLSYVQFKHKAIVFKIWLVLVLYWLLWSTTQKCNCPKSIDFFSALFKSLPDWSLHEINLLSW